MEGGSKAGLKNVKYKEVRQFTKGTTEIKFFFVARCYGEYMKSIIAKFETEPPDVIIMNSCLWDLCRYGKNANSEFKTNINKLLEAIGLVMPYDSKRIFIWNATLPVIDSSQTSCVPFHFPQCFRPEDKNVRNANLYVRDQMVDYGDNFLFLDLYDVFHSHLDHRIHDGVHWDSFAHRKLTHSLLTEISMQWDFELPANGPSLFRSTIRPSLTSIPSIGGRRSVGFVPKHSTSPYQRPSPRTNTLVNDSPQRLANPLVSPYSAMPGARMLRQNPLGPNQCAPRPRFQFPCMLANSLTRPFSPRPWPFVFGAGPCHWRTSPLNVYNGPLPRPRFDWLLNSTFPPAVRKRKWEEDVYSAPINDYKRPRKFL